MIRKLCQPHTYGVRPDAPKFFYESCVRCQEKKAKGVVTGDEGPMPPLAPRKKRSAAEIENFTKRINRVVRERAQFLNGRSQQAKLARKG